LSPNEGTRNRLVRNFAGERARSEKGVPFLRHAATFYLRNALLPDGSLAVKEDVEGICSARRETMFTPDTASNGSRR
jgi:hypothetical protein